MADTNKHQYKDTLNLPRTDFPIRAHARENDPKIVDRWSSEQLATRAMECNAGNQQFILHDGPPYANGHIHLGHAYNKILKDIITKARRMMGYHVPVVPGWDCHGLPIEQKVASDQPELSSRALKSACREYALRWVETQCREFKRLGVLMDWQHPYVTMSYDYEASILKAFANLYSDGFVSRKNKTITWCPTCQTVLASAEIEYQERKDPSVYILFPVKEDVLSEYVSDDKPMHVVIWTTTPWTVPLNRAVVMRPHTQYAIVDVGDYYAVVAEGLVSDVFGDDAHVVATFDSQQLSDAKVVHPMTGRETPIVLDALADVSEGTGVVHSAPGCGPVDYEIGVKYGLEIYSPIEPDGTYSQEIVPHELAGKSIADGNAWVLKALAESGHILRKTSCRHNYPHCWRCHNPLIFRATPQWFINLETHDVKSRALDAINGIQFSPHQGKNFLYATVENRWEWCISRQRVWGVPIPALLSRHNDPAYTNYDFIKAIADKVSEHGIEYWDAATPEKLVEDGILPSDFPVHDYYCETDILDVWFDAGVSHYAVLAQRQSQRVPADLYLEGVDQHRGWFQSSLFTGMALHNQPPMRGIMTHGFTVDADGYKMSKSRGNVVSPDDIMQRIGTDGLRLWVASIGNEGDAVVSDAVLTNVSQVYRKIRNTCRFLLQNLYDYHHERDAVAFDQLLPIDRYALQMLYDINSRIIEHYASGQVSGIFHDMADYVSSQLSALYVDIVKDRLYCEQPDGIKRRSAQTVFWYILDTVNRLMAPILSFTSEQLADHYQHDTPSIHLQRFAMLHEVRDAFSGYTSSIADSAYTTSVEQMRHNIDTHVEWFAELDMWSHVMEVRDAVLKAIEELREQGVVRHSLEAQVALYVDAESTMHRYLQQLAELARSSEQGDLNTVLKELFVVSQIVWHDTHDDLQKTDCDGVYVKAEQASGQKCPRCWHWDPYVSDYGVCQRCQQVLSVNTMP